MLYRVTLYQGSTVLIQSIILHKGKLLLVYYRSKIVTWVKSLLRAGKAETCHKIPVEKNYRKISPDTNICGNCLFGLSMSHRAYTPKIGVVSWMGWHVTNRKIHFQNLESVFSFIIFWSPENSSTKDLGSYVKKTITCKLMTFKLYVIQGVSIQLPVFNKLSRAHFLRYRHAVCCKL